MRILRAKPYHPRQVAVWMLRGIHAEYQQGAEPRTLQDGDRVRIVLMMQEVRSCCENGSRVGPL